MDLIDNNNQTNNTDKSSAVLTPHKLKELSNKIIANTKAYTAGGQKTRRTPEADALGDKSPYDYYERQDTFENNQWSVYYWKYDDGKWEIQLTKIELKFDGHSEMATYSVRPDDDENFPGIQVYLEEKDRGFRPADAEDIVYLDRISEGLRTLNS